jgi:hypothetical protein
MYALHTAATKNDKLSGQVRLKRWALNYHHTPTLFSLLFIPFLRVKV